LHLFYFSYKNRDEEDGAAGDSISHRGGSAWAEARGGGGEFEACIKLSLAAIRSDLGVLLDLDFNGDEILCAVF
jgi:hypothetical protein